MLFQSRGQGPSAHGTQLQETPSEEGLQMCSWVQPLAGLATLAPHSYHRWSPSALSGSPCLSTRASWQPSTGPHSTTFHFNFVHVFAPTQRTPLPPEHLPGLSNTRSRGVLPLPKDLVMPSLALPMSGGMVERVQPRVPEVILLTLQGIRVKGRPH